MNINNLIQQAIQLQANDNRRNKQPPKRDTSYGQGEESDE